jgi:hypothetical protein
VRADESEAQRIINHFKEWAPAAMSRYKSQLESELAAERNDRLQKLRIEKEAEERRLRVMKDLKF